MKTFTVDLFLTETKRITKQFQAENEDDAQDLIYEYQQVNSVQRIGVLWHFDAFVFVKH